MKAGRKICRKAFTILEMLISCVLLIVILGLVMNIMGGASNLWIKHRNDSAAFEVATSAFTALTKSISQAVLNTYWQVDQTSNRYSRASELHLVMDKTVNLLGQSDFATYPGMAIFFQAPIGRADNSLRRLPVLLNAVGYFVHFGNSPDVPPIVQGSTASHDKFRFRLYEWLQPSENFNAYASGSTPSAQQKWFRDDVTTPTASNPRPMKNSSVFAENVLGLIMMAEYPGKNGTAEVIRRKYIYDSRDIGSSETMHQLPPKIRIFMMVIDEASATRLESGSSVPDLYPQSSWFSDPDMFETDMDAWKNKIEGIKPHVNYRIFSATVNIQNAKWSVN